MKRICIVVLIFALLLFLSACGEKVVIDPTEPVTTHGPQKETKPQAETTQATEQTEPADALSALRAEMKPQIIAVADFGFPELSEDRDVMDFLWGKYPEWMALYDFVADMPEEQIVLTCDYDTAANLVCIVPRDTATSIRVNVTRYTNTPPYEKWEVVYSCETGDPILLLASDADNVSVSVDIADGEGRETTWYSFKGGTEPFPGDARSDGLVMDFSPAAHKNAYQNALDRGWTAPDLSLLEYYFGQSDYRYQFELYYNPTERSDGDIYIYDYCGTDTSGMTCYNLTYQGRWLYTDGMLEIDIAINLEDDGLQMCLPILTDPYGKGKLAIFRAEDGAGLPQFREAMQCDILEEIGDGMSPYDYAISQGWRLPEIQELVNSQWRSYCGYAMDLMDDGVSGDNAGEVTIYAVDEDGAYTKSYTGAWKFEGDMLHLLLVPVDNGQFIDDSFPVLMLDGELWIGRNEYGMGLPHFYADMLNDVLHQSVG